MNVINADGTWVLEPAAGKDLAISEDVRAKIEAWIATGKLQLPVMPEASALLISMTSNEDCTIQELSDVVQRDPLLAAHLLRIANSALYSPAYPSSSLRQAIQRLGMRELRRVAVTIATQTKVFRLRGWESEVEELLLHSLTTALYASEIANTVRVGDEEAFLGGLLHDVGHPVVLQGLAEMQKTDNLDIPRAVMLELADQHHTNVGSRLVEQWGLSPRLAEVIARHHDSVNKPATLLAIVHLADVLAYADPEKLETLEQDEVIGSLALSPAMLEDLVAKRRQIIGLAGALM
ncbi:MAG: HDOD domain-containing protein [Polyangiaceae bacterium]